MWVWMAVALAGDPRIVGGQLAAPGDWPDAAAVGFRDQRANIQCTGTLIAPDVVITAAHCVTSQLSHVIVNTTDYEDASEGERIGVREVIEYPSSQQTYDVALLLLDRAATTATPRTIATGCVLDQFLQDGADVAIAGFGAHDQHGNQYDGYLREAFTVVTDADCSSTGRGCERDVSPNGEIGADGNGVDTCYGDSGGPLYLDTPYGYYLVGVTSRGWNDVTVDCAQGGIYVRPDAIFDWIEDRSGRTLPVPTCGDNDPPAPTAPDVSVAPGASVQVTITPNDPDGGQTHTYTLVTPPAHGEITGDGGATATFTADADYEGTDSFTVRVTDNGAPPAWGEVTVQVSIVEGDPAGDDTGFDVDRGARCGCATSGPPIGAVPLLALLAVRRRRHRVVGAVA